MAAALLSTRAGDSIIVRSAGTAPAESINPLVVEAMRELDIDVLANNATPKKLNDEMVTSTDLVITMGCGDTCPYYPGVEYLDWPVSDPAGQDLATVRIIRDDISARVDELLARFRHEQRIPN